ncbi:hypothetical protein LCGC14_0702020 [marine sediment metagenome]|uniref:Isochorismatase-like domain-containing protein n=1 Tax=marine sediment metagenome TaxID=412755 RepID=A0A0F9QHI6_9ZZZZ
MTRLKRYTLVIIDMQPRFDSAYGNRPLIKKIRQEIARAIELSNHIMFVWLTCSGKITPALKAAVRGYSSVSYVPKTSQDGGTEVLEALPRKTHIRFCGVNTNQCVQDTVLTVAKDYARNNYAGGRLKIEVIANGCASFFDSNHDAGLRIMNAQSNIKIDRAA